MDSLFGRKKSRPRQSSVSGQDLNERSIPYDKLAPPPRSPIPVGTVSQGLRGGAGANYISAPITNPTLTPNGTELNIYAMQRSKVERDRIYAAEYEKRSGSPSTVSTADSSTLYTDSSSGSSRPKTPTSRVRRSEASSSSSRSPSLADFGQFAGAQSNPASAPLNSPNSGYFPPSPNGQVPSSVSNTTIRPGSGMTTRSDNRGSKYAPSLTANDSSSSHHSHLSHFYHHNNRHNDDFYFPRPENDTDIEALFENVKRTRDLGDMPDLPIEQKWHMVYNDEHIRWKEEKIRDEQAKKQVDSNDGGESDYSRSSSPGNDDGEHKKSTLSALHDSNLRKIMQIPRNPRQ